MKKIIRILLQVVISIVLFVLITYLLYTILPGLFQVFNNIGEKYTCQCSDGMLCAFTCTRIWGIDISPSAMEIVSYAIWLLPLFISAVIIFLLNSAIHKIVSKKSLPH